MARILIYAMNYAPEVAGVARYTSEISLYFVAMGHEVCVLTTVPHYPGWKVQPPYRNGRYYREARAGVRLVRCPLALRERIGGIWRLIAPFSFALTSAPLALWLALRQRPDTVLAIEPTLLVAPMALLAARLVSAKTVLHVQDLEVDASFAVGHLASRAWLMRLAERFERLILRRFDRLITISARMAERLADKGVASDRIAVVRNCEAATGIADGQLFVVATGQIKETDPPTLEARTDANLNGIVVLELERTRASVPENGRAARVCDAAAEGDCQDAVVLKLRRAQPHSRNVEAALELALFFFILVTLLDGPQVLQL